MVGFLRRLALFAFAVIFCTIAASLYGIVHDMITARLSAEYFSFASPFMRIMGTSPTLRHLDGDVNLLALFWGVVASCWIGALGGICTGVAATIGRAPALGAMHYCNLVCKLFAMMACCAVIAGLIGFGLGRVGTPSLIDPDAIISPAKQAAFNAVDSSNKASYVIGIVGIFVLSIKIWKMRCRSD
jgi:hypothetical protein